MSKYIIYSKNITNGFQEELTPQQFEELAKSKEILGEVFAKEKIYDIILMNYYEFEKELFEITLEDEIFNSDYVNFNEYISKTEQRILNLLSSITLYLDSFKDDLKGTQEYSTYLNNEFTVIVIYLNEARTDNKQVEIMRLLRNHIQHNGLLITNFSLNGIKLSDELREQTLKFEIEKISIKARDFKPENFEELDEKIDLKKAIRIYVDFISQNHQNFRESTNEKAINARSEFEKIFEKYSEHKFLYVAQKVEDEINEFLHQDITWEKVHDFLFQEVSFGKAK